MKSKKELDALREGETENENLRELSDDDLSPVSGGDNREMLEDSEKNSRLRHY